jgi:hypothetical protein
LRGWRDDKHDEVPAGAAGPGGEDVLEHGFEYPSEWAAIESISPKLGMTKEIAARWVRRRRWTVVGDLE